jgi:hypothetical protein
MNQLKVLFLLLVAFSPIIAIFGAQEMRIRKADRAWEKRKQAISKQGSQGSVP